MVFGFMNSKNQDWAIIFSPSYELCGILLRERSQEPG